MVHFHTIGMLETLSDDINYLSGWFNVISRLVEPNGFGTKYPYFFEKLYSTGKEIFMNPENGKLLLIELNEIESLLKQIPASQVLIKKEPLFEKVSEFSQYVNLNAENAYELFKPFYNQNLFECIKSGVAFAVKMNATFKIDSYPVIPGTNLPQIPQAYLPQIIKK